VRDKRDLGLRVGRTASVGTRAVYPEVVLRVHHVRRVRAIAPRVLVRQRTVHLSVRPLVGGVCKSFSDLPYACSAVAGSLCPTIMRWKSRRSL